MSTESIFLAGAQLDCEVVEMRRAEAEAVLALRHDVLAPVGLEPMPLPMLFFRSEERLAPSVAYRLVTAAV